MADYYSSNFSIDEVDFIFRLDMLSNNIDFLFGSYNFNDIIKIDTNKKIRRHTSIHGVKYSNERVDTLLLLNTLYELLCFKEVLKPFEKSLRFNKKEKGFYCTSDYEQAYKWADRKSKKGIVNVYSYTPNDDLKILKFDKMTDEWLDFIAKCRAGYVHDYDIVEGPMADDTIWNFVNDFFAGNISRKVI